MDPTHLHLMLNHVPVVGIPLGLALLAIGLALGSTHLRVAALLVFLLCSAVAGVVFLTGEPAEHRVETIPGISETYIEAHEEAAEVAIWGAIALGGVATIALVLHLPRRLPRSGMRLRTASLAAPLVLGIAVAFMLFRTANLGGQIRHSEIRSSAPASTGDTHADADASDLQD